MITARHLCVDRVSIVFSPYAYSKLYKPPAVQLAFIDHDLLISAGDGWLIKNFRCRPKDINTFLKPGFYDMEPTPQPGVYIVRGCTHHHYKDHRAWANQK